MTFKNKKHKCKRIYFDLIVDEQYNKGSFCIDINEISDITSENILKYVLDHIDNFYKYKEYQKARLCTPPYSLYSQNPFIKIDLNYTKIDTKKLFEYDSNVTTLIVSNIRVI